MKKRTSGLFKAIWNSAGSNFYSPLSSECFKSILNECKMKLAKHCNRTVCMQWELCRNHSASAQNNPLLLFTCSVYPRHANDTFSFGSQIALLCLENAMSQLLCIWISPRGEEDQLLPKRIVLPLDFISCLYLLPSLLWYIQSFF